MGQTGGWELNAHLHNNGKHWWLLTFAFIVKLFPRKEFSIFGTIDLKQAFAWEYGHGADVSLPHNATRTPGRMMLTGDAGERKKEARKTANKHKNEQGSLTGGSTTSAAEIEISHFRRRSCLAKSSPRLVP